MSCVTAFNAPSQQNVYCISTPKSDEMENVTPAVSEQPTPTFSIMPLDMKSLSMDNDSPNEIIQSTISFVTSTGVAFPHTVCVSPISHLSTSDMPGVILSDFSSDRQVGHGIKPQHVPEMKSVSLSNLAELPVGKCLSAEDSVLTGKALVSSTKQRSLESKSVSTIGLISSDKRSLSSDICHVSPIKNMPPVRRHSSHLMRHGSFLMERKSSVCQVSPQKLHDSPIDVLSNMPKDTSISYASPIRQHLPQLRGHECFSKVGEDMTDFGEISFY